jgi:tetratricopeptide (TPR) repeat protein
MMRRRLSCIALWAATVAGPALAQVSISGYPDSVRAYDYREVAMLPNYCKFTQEFRDKIPEGGDAEMVARWYGYLGETFHHMHHYCWGLMKTNRGLLLARNSRTRNFYVADAITEFDYVIERAPRDFILLPEILTRKGMNMIQLGMGPQAVAQFEQAVELKPDYWPPYVSISDFYASVGERTKAIEAIDRGLKAAPDAAALVRRRADLLAGKAVRSAGDGSASKSAER